MRKKTKQGIKIGLLFVMMSALVFSGIYAYWKYEQKKEMKAADLTERASQAEASSQLFSEGELTDDVRIHKYTFIHLTERMKKGDFIDIRISFSNGGDFILLSKKQIADISYGNPETGEENALWLYVAEEEILRLSSGVVDAYYNEGSKIYAIQYVSEEQKEAFVNYPVNQVVKQLIEDDPNIVKKAENVLEWGMWNEISKENLVNETEAAVKENLSGEGMFRSDDIFSSNENSGENQDEEISFFN